MNQRSSKSWEIDYDSLNVPEVVKMTEAAKVQFAKEYMYYDFSVEEFSYIILLAWESAKEKDNVKHISMRQYRYFATFINNQIEELGYKDSLGI